MRRSILLVGSLVALTGGWLLWSALVDTVLFQPRPGVDLSLAQIAPNGEEVFLETEDGVRIHGFWVPSEGARCAVLFLHGNAGNASMRLPNAAALSMLGANVLLLDYRGYGRSEGTPSESGLYADARAGLRHLREQRGVPTDQTIVFGRSLGGAVAVEVAQDQPFGAVILESTFTSIRDMAQVLLPVAALLVPNRFDSASKVERLRAPVLFLHGDLDELVPYEMGIQLFDASPEPKAFETVAGAGHNDTVRVGGRRYFQRIREVLAPACPLHRGSTGG